MALSAQAPRLRSFHFGHILGGFVSFGVRPLVSSRFISVLCFFFVVSHEYLVLALGGL